MATHIPHTRFARRPVFDRRLRDGAWWRENRRLSDQLGRFFAFWPEAEGRIARVLYSPPDWEDHPRSVAVPGRMVKTGSFPGDDTHQLTLSLLDGSRRSITVIAAETPVSDAEEILDVVRGFEEANRRPSYAAAEQQPGWENGDGHL
jgi:Family of unknown function (DUF5994)